MPADKPNMGHRFIAANVAVVTASREGAEPKAEETSSPVVVTGADVPVVGDGAGSGPGASPAAPHDPVVTTTVPSTTSRVGVLEYFLITSFDGPSVGIRTTVGVTPTNFNFNSPSSFSIGSTPDMNGQAVCPKAPLRSKKMLTQENEPRIVFE
jgi:hypothetical protein